MENKILLTVKDVQKELQIGNAKAYALFNQKSFPSIKIGNTHYIKRDRFEEWLDDISKLPNSTYIINEPTPAIYTASGTRRRNAKYA